MNLGAFAIDHKVFGYFAGVLAAIAGIAGYFSLGQLEDPNFTVKTAVIQTPYPGATPSEVELEVTDRIEVAIQELKEVKYVESFSTHGLSYIRVEIKPEYWSDRLPQIWDQLRRKVREVETQLPPGAGRPAVADDYGDVFGLLLAVTGDGFSYAELERYAKDLRKELSRLKGVARVEFWGVQQKVIYLDVAQTQLSALGLSDDSLVQTLRQQNQVVEAGKVDVQNQRLPIQTTGEFRSPADIADLTIRPSLMDTAQRQRDLGDLAAASELIRIRDIGKVRRGYREPPMQIMRYNGQPAVGIYLSNLDGVNIVELGRTVDRRIDELIVELLPVGLEVHRVHWQSDIVDAAVKNFLQNFVEAVAIVLLVLTVFMGWRMGVIIGVNLILTVLATFIVMAIMDIDLHRMSLGALVIALGMMVDNAIVVADDMTVRIQRGVERRTAAIEATGKHSLPLLGATIIAVMAFSPIYLSPGDTGEYCRTLFTMVAISLLASWVFAMTITPLQCVDMLPEPGPGEGEPYQQGFYRGFRRIAARAIRYRWLTLGSMFALLLLSIAGFGAVERLFFPTSSMNKFMVDYWAPQGTRIEQVAADLRQLEQKLLADERIDNVSTFIGAGPPRFYLPVQPEDPNSAYAQLVVNVHDFREIEGLITQLTPWLEENYPGAVVPLRQYSVGPSKTWKFDLRISGPAVADPQVLRALSVRGAEILDSSPYAYVVRSDWRQRAPRIVPHYNRERGRWSGVTRDDVAQSIKRAYDGRDIGLYREGDDLIPIVLRYLENERQQIDNLPALPVKPALSTNTLPLAQVVDEVQLEWVDDLIWRRDRRRTIKLQSNPVLGATLPTLREDVEQRLFAMPLPPGYAMHWGGETEDEADASEQLTPGMIPALVLMLLVMVALFNDLRPPLIIVLAVPLGIIGIVAGLLLFRVPFGFMALLGGLSLSGMMIKNAIVLLDEVRDNLASGSAPLDAVLDAAVSRLRPVMLAAATTVLGVIPLLEDVFWVGLATAIMAGLGFGAVLTMVIVPVLYATVYRIKSPPEG